MLKVCLYALFLCLFTFCASDTSSTSTPGAEAMVPKGYLATYDFVDSITYRPDKNLILAILAIPETHKLAIHLYRNQNGLQLIQTLDSLRTQFGETEPVFEDFNGDGIPDVKLPFGTGARGANELFHLLLQDKKTGMLRSVKGAEHIPNLHYDKERKTITAVYYYSGTSFVDFTLQQDSLIETGGVDVAANEEWTFREHYSIRDGNKRFSIKRDSIQDFGAGLYARD